MPIKSAKQFRLMQAAKSGKSNIGPSPKVAKEMLSKTSHKKKSNYARKGNPHY